MYILDSLEQQVADLKQRLQYLRNITPRKEDQKIFHSFYKEIEGFKPAQQQIRWERKPVFYRLPDDEVQSKSF